MAKARVCAMILLGLLLSGYGYAGEVTIGTGTNRGNVPLSSQRTQTIYLASEIGGSCRITALGLNVETVPVTMLGRLTIRLRHTPLNSYVVGSWESQGWVTVYQANEMITSTGWHMFAFTTAFNYNGTDNLMVDVSSSAPASGYCYYTTIATNRTCVGGGSGDPLTWSGSTPVGMLYAKLPNLKLQRVDALTPWFDPLGGVFDSDPEVTITCDTPGAVIHYTTNGLDPIESDPIIESGTSVIIHPPMTLKARAWYAGAGTSDVDVAFYDIPTAATPSFSPSGGAVAMHQSIAITCSTPDAVIHYTTNGLIPTETDPVVASGSMVQVQPPITLKARAWKERMHPSPTRTASYTIAATATPTLSVLGGSYSLPFNVRIACATSDAVIHYTTSGSDPTESSPIIASGASILVERSMILKAKAWKTDWLPSAVTTATYTLPSTIVAAPVFAPDEGTYTSEVSVRVTCSTLWARIHYTTDLATPAEDDPFVYSGSTIPVERSTVLKARAFYSGWTPSAVKSAYYTIVVAKPDLWPNGGTYTTPMGVTVDCSTPSAVFHYTTNGAIPTESDPVVGLSEPIFVGHTMTLKVRAFKTGCQPSEVASADFRIRMPLPVGVLKWHYDGEEVAGYGPLVSAAFPDCFYIEADDRSCGVRVNKTGHGLSPGMLVDLIGTMATNSDGERCVQATAAVVDGSGDILKPFFMRNNAVGGGDWRYDPSRGMGQRGPGLGANNIGLLICTTGRVTYSESAFFYIDDGSALDDGSGHRGLRVLGQVPVAQGENPVGKYVKVTAISSCYKSGSDLFRLLRATDIVIAVE